MKHCHALFVLHEILLWFLHTTTTYFNLCTMWSPVDTVYTTTANCTALSLTVLFSPFIFPSSICNMQFYAILKAMEILTRITFSQIKKCFLCVQFI